MQLNLPKFPFRGEVSPNRIQTNQTEAIPTNARRSIISFQNSQRPQREAHRILLPLEDQQILNINCMNCQELIPLEQIEDHSKICTTVPENVKVVESESYFSQILFKLKKLESCLLELIKNSELRPGDKNYITIFTRLCRKAITGSAIEETDSVITSLSSLLITFKGSLSIRVYADRLQALVQEQKLSYQELEIEYKKQELEKIKEEVEKYKNRSQVLQKTMLKTTSIVKSGDMKRKLDEITSDLGSIFSGSSEATVVSGIEEDKYDMEVPLNGITNDLQKHFYSLCLSYKMRHSAAKIQSISIQRLYKEALDNKLPPDSWPEFITNQLKNPMKFNDDKGKKRFQPKGFALNQQYFEVIVEEDNSKGG